MEIVKMLFSLVLVGLVGLFGYLCNIILLEPERLRSKLRRQGIRGPPPSFLYGNIPQMKKIQSGAAKASREDHHISHNWASSVFPYFEQWRNKYGPIFMYSTGNVQILYVTHSDVVKEMSMCTSLDLGKPTFLREERWPLFGNGILASSGKIWVHQRKIISPEFYPDKVKDMVNIMLESATLVMKSWESRIEGEGGIADIRVDEDLRNLSADIISKACFGSSYSEGKEIFLKLRSLQKIMSKGSLLIGVPGLRYLPSKKNREIWRLDKEIRSLILKVVKERIETKNEKDLLQMIIEAAKDNGNPGLMDSTDNFVVDNCKGIYFAGHETTAVSAAWSLMLLAANPEWQSRVRAEVVQVCGGRLPNSDMLGKMKTLTMVIQEALRLYPPAAFIAREAFQEMKFGNIQIPKGTNIWIPILMLHEDRDIWGPDVHEFNPERFASGVLGSCKVPHAYMPFGTGSRTCVGQNFAMVELKVVLSLIVSKFSFSLSPKYRHAPAFKLVIEPEHGVVLHIRRLT
ncbi:hypothetical protein HHK36_028393 [Tetracentron sinense]|uniref:Cytochrome P450 n=1 Tax=Tetracentron sinense TaxID=13715 RepID=A0A835D069_TETSI|nr:hypothetical protein HHK36_028393 [Tetracentron sinense]